MLHFSPTIFLFKDMSICCLMSTKVILYEGLAKTHIRSTSQENFKRRGDWETFLNDLRSELIAWHLTWLYDNEVLMYGVNKDPIFLISFHRIEAISPIRMVRQFGWVQPIPLTMNFSQFTLRKTRVNQKIAMQSWKFWKRMKDAIRNDAFGMVNRVTLNILDG